MRVLQPRLKAVAPLVVAATLALAATTASGLEPSRVAPIPDSAFHPVVLNTDRAGAPAHAPVPPGALEPAAVAPAPVLAPVPTQDPRGLYPLADPLIVSAPPARPQPSLPESTPIVVRSWTHSISGRASWYCNSDDPSVPYSICHRSYPDGPGFDAYAAAGPGLRAALGSGWRNTVVQVCGRSCVKVKLVDWCQCMGGSVGPVKLIDLYNDVYARTGGNVTIRW